MKTWEIFMCFGLMFYTVGEYFSKIYANTLNAWYMPLTALCYLGGTCMWFVVIKNNNQLALMSTVWAMAGLVIGIFMGVIVFKEVLTVTQWLGVALAFVSTYLLLK